MSALPGRYPLVASPTRGILRSLGLVGVWGVAGLFVIVILLHVVLTHFFWEVQSTFAIARLDLGPDHPPVFFKRENWGLMGNGEDSGLTLTPGRCTPLDEESDYMFNTYKEYLVYRWDGTSLHVYSGKEAPQYPPGSYRFPFPVIRHRRAPWGLGSDDWLRHEGAIRVDLQHNPTPCLSYWESMLPGLKSLKKALGVPTEL